MSRRSGDFWTEQDYARLRALRASGKTDQEIGRALNRSEAAVCKARHKLGLTSAPVHQGVGWTDERVALLRQLVAEGLNGSQIAERLGGVSRNAVIGKVHRLQGVARISGGRRTTPEARKAAVVNAALRARDAAPPVAPPAAPPASPPASPPARAAARPPALAVPVAPPPPDVVDLAGVRLEALTPGACRWPVGVDARGVIVFCGAQRAGEGPYCADHAAKARAAVQPAPLTRLPEGRGMRRRRRREP